jgi:hypothetical protein
MPRKVAITVNAIVSGGEIIPDGNGRFGAFILSTSISK